MTASQTTDGFAVSLSRFDSKLTCPELVYVPTVFLTLALGFFLFSVASLRTAVLSRTVGFLLLVPTVAWVGLIVGNVVAPSGDYLGVLAYTPISIALLAIGYLLRGEPSPTDRAGPASDTVA